MLLTRGQLQGLTNNTTKVRTPTWTLLASRNLAPNPKASFHEAANFHFPPFLHRLFFLITVFFHLLAKFPHHHTHIVAKHGAKENQQRSTRWW